MQGWIDVAKLVSGGGGVKSAYKDLAYRIGEFPAFHQYIFLIYCKSGRMQDLAVFVSAKAEFLIT